MKISERSAWVALIAVTVMLLSALAFLYAKSRHSGESGYFENVALLRQLKQLDAQWELNVLKARIGISPHYDPLAAWLIELSAQLESLGAGMRAQEHDQSAEQLQAHAMLLGAFERKAALIEEFKSNNAVLRNSLAFLPTAAKDIRATFGPSRVDSAPALGHILANVDSLLLATMLFSHSTSSESGGEIRAGLRHLNAALPGLSPDRRERLAIFGAHVRTVLLEQRHVNDLLGTIAEVPTAGRIDEIGNALANERLRDEEQHQRYRTYLLIFSAALLAMLLLAAIYLLRSHAMINRVNRDLQSANENLEQRVADGNRELRQITDAVPAMIVYVDHERRYRFHNKATEDSMGLTSEEIDGRTVREVVGDEIYERLCPWIDQVLAGIPVRFEYTRSNVRGGTRDLSIQDFPRRKGNRDDQPVIGYYGLFTDITETRRINRMKTEFVSTVSHELRTPLTSIRGSLGLIAGGMAGVLPDAAKGLVDIAKSNCERLIRLINDILDSEKIESGKMRVDLQVVELQSVVALSIAANEGFAAQHAVTIKLVADSEAVRVSVDIDALSQVLTNLLANAVKFSPAGGTVDVDVTRGKERIRVEVRDRGPGIPPEFRDRIFQKFSQADSSDSRQKGGTGLGLSISKAIVEHLGGTIGFRDHPECGTIFFFELPEWRDLPAPLATTAAHGSKRPRVLVCEDHADIARLIGMMLDSAGYDADLACSAAQARELAASRPYAAMTIDLQLPGQSGIALMRALREDDVTRDLPIVVVSANREEGRAEVDSERLPVSAWLDKPIDANRLVAAMHEAVANRARPVESLAA